MKLEWGSKGVLPNHIVRFAAGLRQTTQIKPFAAFVHASEANYYKYAMVPRANPTDHTINFIGSPAPVGIRANIVLKLSISA
jgi:hypothetical protein